MKENPPFIPDGSQTVGPYFRIGLEYLMDREPKLKPEEPDVVEIAGRVLDANGAPVPDAMLEFWSPRGASEFWFASLNPRRTREAGRLRMSWYSYFAGACSAILLPAFTSGRSLRMMQIRSC